MTNLVSIVIVSYNNWPDLEMTIQSALQQTYKPAEVIVVDNSSSDATAAEVPKRFGDSVRFVQQPNKRDAGAYNRGFELADGDFVQFIDGDDLLAPNKIEKQMEVFAAQPEVEIVYGDVRQFQSVPGSPQWEDRNTPNGPDMLMHLGEGLYAHSVLFRRSALEKIGPWDENLWVCDRDYWLRAEWLGCKFAYCPESLCFYRRRPGQMTSNQYEYELLRGMEAVWKKALGYITSEPYRSNIKIRLARTQYHLALYPDRHNSKEARQLLAAARATSKEGVSAAAYYVGKFLTYLPAGRMLAAKMRSPGLYSMRKAAGKILGLR